MKVFICPLIIFFLFVHYQGYIRDAALYLLQTVDFLYPERFIGDPQFTFGNQGEYNLFNPLCAAFFKLFSVNAGGIIFTLFLQLNICTALIFFVKKFCASFSKNKNLLTIAIIVAIILYSQASYGCSDDFTMDIFEPFLVARLASQVCILWGLVFFFSKKYVALFFFSLSVAMHPLTGCWAVVLWVLFYYPKCRILAVVFALLFPLLGFLHVGKFDFIYKDWLVRPLYMLPNLNRWFDCISITTVFILFALKFKDSILKKTSVCLSVIAFIAFYWQFIAASTEHVFLYQLQPFRFMWLGLIMLLPLLWSFFREQIKTKDYDNWPMLAIALTLSIQVISKHQSFYIPFIIFAVFFGFNKFVSTRYFQHICCCAILLFIATITIFDYANDFKAFSFVYTYLKYTTILEIEPILKKSVFTLCILMFLFMVRQRKWGIAVSFLVSSCFENAELLLMLTLVFMYNRHLSLFLYNLFCRTRTQLLIFIILSVYAVLFWDARAEYRRNVESDMDYYFENCIFPRINDRGKMFFSVDNESLVLSRFRFMTGAYIDKVIHIGEAFFYEQYKETTRRKNLFAFRKNSFEPVRVDIFEDKVNRIYGNLDSLNNRIDLLCGKNEIKYIVTDQEELVGQTIDSMYIKNHKKILLKECQ